MVGSWNIPLERDWRIVNTALTLPRYEHSVATVPASKVSSQLYIQIRVLMDNVCVQVQNCGFDENEV